MEGEKDNAYWVRVYVVKHFDVDVRAASLEEAADTGVEQALSECTWFDKNTCALLDHATEVTLMKEE